MYIAISKNVSPFLKSSFKKFKDLIVQEMLCGKKYHFLENSYSLSEFYLVTEKLLFKFNAFQPFGIA